MILLKLQIFIPLFILLASPINSIQQKCPQVSETHLSSNQSHPDPPIDTYLRKAFNYSDHTNDTSQQPAECPLHSMCTENGFCKCEKGYILGCETSAHELTFSNESFEIENEERLYFEIAPLRLNQYLTFKLTFCESISRNQEGNSRIDVLQDQEQLFLYDMRIYADFGVMHQIDDQFQVLNATIPSYDNYCWKIMTPVIEFGTMMNGQRERLILSIERINKERFKEITNSTSRNLQEINKHQSLKSNTNKKTIELSVMQLIVYNPNQNNFATFVMITLLLLSSLITCVTFLLLWIQYRRYGGRLFTPQRANSNDLSHFQNYIPKYKPDENSKEVQNQDTCSICFLQFQSGCVMRQTLCSHIFHAECLEKWCVNNLTCPVCRGCLKKKTMKKILKNRKTLRLINELQKNCQDKEQVERRKMEMIEDQLLEKDKFSGIEECDDPLESEYRKKKGALGQWLRRRKVKRNRKQIEQISVTEPSSMCEEQTAHMKIEESL